MHPRAAGHSARPFVETAADRRTQELDTLHALGVATADTLDVADALRASLGVLVDQGWFTCGEAILRRGEAWTAVGVGLCAHDSPDSCPVRPAMERAAREALAAGSRRERAGWHLLPIDDEAVLALLAGGGAQRGGAASPAFLDAITTLVGSAVKRAQLHRRLSQKETQRSRLLRALLTAQEEERTRISRDLHDQIGQALTGILLGLDKSIGQPDPVELHRLKQLASETLGDVRRIALDLRPSVLDELGLEAGLRRYARDVHERFGIRVSVVASLAHRLDKQAETVLYRVVQEAITNVVRHAVARNVSVVLTAGPHHVQLVVEDDGRGFDPELLIPAEKLGIMGMSERMEVLGGSLNIESRIGGGCTVYARLPLR